MCGSLIKQRKNLKRYKEVYGMYMNENGEYVIKRTYTDEDGQTVRQTKTYRNNGWIRINEVYPDGTETETFERE